MLDSNIQILLWLLAAVLIAPDLQTALVWPLCVAYPARKRRIPYLVLLEKLHENPYRLCAMGLLLVMLGCSKITLENYNEVTQLIGPPDECDDVMGVRNCRWGDEKRSINVSFVGSKVLLFASSNLQ